MKRQNGITLIALVITIIVLLILAGASIATLTGENGVLTRSQNAVERNRAGEVQEQINLAVNANKIKEYDIGERITKEQLISKLTEEGKLTPEEITILATEDKITIAGVEVDFSKLNSEIIETISIISASDIEPSDYGKIVKGYTLDNYNGTWEILYADDSNIYLITTNTVTDPVYNAKDMIGALASRTYKTGSSLLTTNQTQYPAASKWFRGWLDSSYAGAGSTNDNMQATLFMLDSTNVWNGTYRNATYADWAIGGPTYELLAESVNDVQGTTYEPVAVSAVGYAYNTISSGLTKGTVWNRNEENYWVTSPSSDRFNGVCFVFHGQGHVGWSELKDDNIGFRPVVCLNSSVQLEEGADGRTYAIKK